MDNKGDLFVTKSLDREKKNAYHLTAMMSDAYGNRIENPGEFVVQVTDINDNTPVFTQSYNGSIEERSRIGKYYQGFFIFYFVEGIASSLFQVKKDVHAFTFICTASCLNCAVETYDVSGNPS